MLSKIHASYTALYIFICAGRCTITRDGFEIEDDAIDHLAPDLEIKWYVVEHAILEMHNRWLLINQKGVRYEVGLVKRLDYCTKHSCKSLACARANENNKVSLAGIVRILLKPSMNEYRGG